MNYYEGYTKELNEILEALSNCNFDDLEDGYEFETQVITPFKSYYNKNFDWASGATKGVLIFKNYGFVLKIPFSYISGDPICNAYDGLDTWDYCSQEANRYSMAETEGLQDVFLETSLLDNINNYPIYIQPYAQIFKNMETSDISKHSCISSEEEKQQTKSINEEYSFDDITNIWESEILALYGKDYYIKLKSFISDVDINDLRTANIGYYNNKPVLVDYAGFYE